MSQFYAVSFPEFNSARSACDCLAHRFGNAADQPERVPVYNSDMTDEEWVVVRDALPTPGWMEGRGGRPEGYCHRQMIDAVFYVTDNGTKWRSLPVDFPPWDRVYAFSRRWRRDGLVKELHDRLREEVRVAEGRDAEPTAGIIDSQSVKAAASVPAASRG
jgi:transposase